MKARVSRCRQEQIQAEHEWDNANGDDRDRPRMVDDNDPDSQALTTGDITRYRALVVRISYLSQDRPDLKFASMQVCCAMAKQTTRDIKSVKRIGRYLVEKPKAKCWFRWQQSGELEAYSDADRRCDKAVRRSVAADQHHRLRVLGERQEPEEESADVSEMTCSRRGTQGILAICRLSNAIQCKKFGDTKMHDMTVRVGMRRTRSSDVCQLTRPTQVLLRIEVFDESRARARGRVFTDST